MQGIRALKKHVLFLLDAMKKQMSKIMNVLELEPQNINNDPDIISLFPFTPKLRQIDSYARNDGEEKVRTPKFSAAVEG